jgi:hypothetical protein
MGRHGGDGALDRVPRTCGSARHATRRIAQSRRWGLSGATRASCPDPIACTERQAGSKQRPAGQDRLTTRPDSSRRGCTTITSPCAVPSSIERGFVHTVFVVPVTVTSSLATCARLPQAVDQSTA